MCLHAWSLNVAMGASAPATSSTGGVRAKAIDGEENLEVGEASSSQKGAVTGDALDAVKATKERGRQEAPGIQSAAADHYQIPGKSEQEVRRQQKLRATKMVRGYDKHR